MNPVDFLLDYLNRFDQGRVLLAGGRVYNRKIKTKGRPVIVWLAEGETGDIPACHGSQNCYSVTKLDDGFILNADVRTDKVELLWQAHLEQPNESVRFGVV